MGPPPAPPPPPAAPPAPAPVASRSFRSRSSRSRTASASSRISWGGGIQLVVRSERSIQSGQGAAGGVRGRVWEVWTAAGRPRLLGWCMAMAKSMIGQDGNALRVTRRRPQFSTGAQHPSLRGLRRHRPWTQIAVVQALAVCQHSPMLSPNPFCPSPPCASAPPPGGRPPPGPRRPPPRAVLHTSDTGKQGQGGHRKPACAPCQGTAANAMHALHQVRCAGDDAIREC